MGRTRHRPDPTRPASIEPALCHTGPLASGHPHFSPNPARHVARMHRCWPAPRESCTDQHGTQPDTARALTIGSPSATWLDAPFHARVASRTCPPQRLYTAPLARPMVPSLLSWTSRLWTNPPPNQHGTQPDTARARQPRAPRLQCERASGRSPQCFPPRPCAGLPR
jgi:hypothetical protein